MVLYPLIKAHRVNSSVNIHPCPNRTGVSVSTIYCWLHILRDAQNESHHILWRVLSIHSPTIWSNCLNLWDNISDTNITLLLTCVNDYQIILNRCSSHAKAFRVPLGLFTMVQTGTNCQSLLMKNGSPLLLKEIFGSSLIFVSIFWAGFWHNIQTISLSRGI